MKNLSTSLTKCQEEIHAQCDDEQLPAVNKTFITACYHNILHFQRVASSCLSLSGAGACTCWAELESSTDLDSIKQCDLKTLSAKVTKSVRKCRSTFAKCRKFEDDVGAILYACM